MSKKNKLNEKNSMKSSKTNSANAKLEIGNEIGLDVKDGSFTGKISSEAKNRAKKNK